MESQLLWNDEIVAFEWYKVGRDNYHNIASCIIDQVKTQKYISMINVLIELFFQEILGEVALVQSIRSVIVTMIIEVSTSIVTTPINSHAILIY